MLLGVHTGLHEGWYTLRHVEEATERIEKLVEKVGRKVTGDLNIKMEKQSERVA